eukprot:UN01748
MRLHFFVSIHASFIFQNNREMKYSDHYLEVSHKIFGQRMLPFEGFKDNIPAAFRSNADFSYGFTHITTRIH